MNLQKFFQEKVSPEAMIAVLARACVPGFRASGISAGFTSGVNSSGYGSVGEGVLDGILYRGVEKVGNDIHL